MGLRVLHVVSGMDPKLGGVSQAIQTMIVGLMQKGVYNEVVCLEDPTTIIPRSASFVIHQLGPVKGPWNYNEKLLPWLLENLHKFDDVIIHGLWLYTSYAVRKATKRIKSRERNDHAGNPNSLKVYVIPHGMLDPYFQKAAGRKLKALRNFMYWKAIESKVVNNADGLLFTSEEEYLLAEKSFQPYLPKKTKVIGLGVDEPPAYSSGMSEVFFDRCAAVKGKPFLLFLSRIHEKKGVDILINAYCSIVESKPELLKLMPKLVIAGPGLESEYGKSIEQLASKNKTAGENIYFCGMLSGDAKWGAFYESEAFILTSHQENFGIAVVEALACGKPALLSNKINIWREIVQGGGGIVAEDTTEGAINLLSDWLSFSEAQKEIMGVKAMSIFETKFSSQVAAKRMLEVI